MTLLLRDHFVPTLIQFMRYLFKTVTYLNFGRTSQIRTGDLYHVKVAL